VQGFFSSADFQGAVPDAVPEINEHTHKAPDCKPDPCDGGEL